MTDIKPDTSLYTDLPSRLRAMALVLEGPGEHVQRRTRSSPAWLASDASDHTRAALAAEGRADYRLKPAPPAKLYVDILPNGNIASPSCVTPTPSHWLYPGTTRVTYVLENPDAND